MLARLNRSVRSHKSVFTGVCRVYATETTKVTQAIQVKDFDKDVLESQVPVLLAAYADWCVPSKKFAPVLDQITNMYKGHVILAKLNVDEFPELMTRLGITAIPWVVLFKDGKQMDKPRIGYKTDVDVANYIREKLKLSIFDALRPK